MFSVQPNENQYRMLLSVMTYTRVITYLAVRRKCG